MGLLNRSVCNGTRNAARLGGASEPPVGSHQWLAGMSIRPCIPDIDSTCVTMLHTRLQLASENTAVAHELSHYQRMPLMVRASVACKACKP